MGLSDIDWVTDDGIVEGYLSDASNTKGFCEGVYRPKDTKDLSVIMKHCNNNGVSVTVTLNAPLQQALQFPTVVC